jgi:hypothetical protein
MKVVLTLIFFMTLLSLYSCSNSVTYQKGPTPQENLTVPLQIIKSMGIGL